MKSSCKRTVRRRSGLIALPVVLLIGCTAALTAEQAGGGKVPVLREVVGSGERQLSAKNSEAISEALHTVAVEAGVVLCFDGGSTDPAFEETCAQSPTNRRYNLKWNPDLRLTNTDENWQMVSVTLTIDVHREKKRKKKTESLTRNLVGLNDELYTPAEYAPTDRDRLLAQSIYDLIVLNPSIYDWFKSLAEFPDLMVERPPGDFPEPAVSKYDVLRIEVPPDPGPDPALVEEWEREADEVADLLIDGEVVAARDRAEALLATEGLPEEIAGRVEGLRAKAQDRIPPPPPPAPKIKPLDATFKVRYAEAGSGFRSGIDGSLRISARDSRFVPGDSKHGTGWSVKWPELKSAGKAGGLWDVGNPLVIETKQGKKYFLAEVLKNGRYGTGKGILEYLEKGRKRMLEGVAYKAPDRDRGRA